MKIGDKKVFRGKEFTNKQFKSLKSYMELIRDMFKQEDFESHAFIFYDYIVNKGKEFKDIPYWEDEKFLEVARWITKHNPQKKHCYYNSQLLAIELKHLGVKYYEGWAYTKKFRIPIEHAWCVCDNRVIDVTWEDGEKYFGIEIPTEEVSQTLIKSGYSSPLLRTYLYDKINIIANLADNPQEEMHLKAKAKI